MLFRSQVLEDLLRMCVLDSGKSWEDHLPYVEFSYNNSFQASIGMAPFEALYGRPCKPPISPQHIGDLQGRPYKASNGAIPMKA